MPGRRVGGAAGLREARGGAEGETALSTRDGFEGEGPAPSAGGGSPREREREADEEAPLHRRRHEGKARREGEAMLTEVACHQGMARRWCGRWGDSDSAFARALSSTKTTPVCMGATNNTGTLCELHRLHCECGVNPSPSASPRLHSFVRCDGGHHALSRLADDHARHDRDHLVALRLGHGRVAVRLGV